MDTNQPEQSRPIEPKRELRFASALVIEEDPVFEGVLTPSVEKESARVDSVGSHQEGINRLIQKKDSGQPYDLAVVSGHNSEFNPGSETAIKIKEGNLASEVVFLSNFPLMRVGLEELRLKGIPVFDKLTQFTDFRTYLRGEEGTTP